jgi:Ala-tRNA(Pro) deacylase
MAVRALKTFLDEHRVKYVSIAHSTAYTAQEVAQSAHIPGDHMAKTVIASIDGDLAMAVLRAPDKVDLQLLKSAARASSVFLADEDEFRSRFPASDPGAMPPFGNLYDMRVYVDEPLSRSQRIAFSAGTHSEVLQLAYADFERLVYPVVAVFSR